MKIARYLALLVVLVLSVITVACGSGSDPGEMVTSTAVAGTPSNPADASAGKLSANNATDEELGGGVRSGGHLEPRSVWAHEVEEYRPYSVDDTDFAKLRRGLAEHNADPNVVDAIIALLELP